MFREEFELAWFYHHNTSRWTHNVHGIATDLREATAFKEYLRSSTTVLPLPSLPTVSLADAIGNRVSCRQFTGEPLELKHYSNLLYAAYGIRARTFLGDQEFFERTVPSGGGLYPLEIYLLLQRGIDVVPGIYHYNVFNHILEQVRTVQFPETLISDLFLQQHYLTKAACIVVITAVLGRSLWKYEDRGYRYILFEAGHVAQNLDLMATAMGIGCLNLGGFFDTQLAELIDIDIENEIPLYCTAVGISAFKDRIAVRME